MRFAYLLILLPLLIASCGDGDLIEIEGVEELSIPYCSDFMEEEYLIDNEETYELFRTQYADTNLCESHGFPSINFDERTLLGKLTTNTACSTTNNRTVFADPDEERYLYQINIFPSGDCETVLTNMNFITIPKLPEGYSIAYEVN